MSYILPSTRGYTIYTRSDCGYCVKVLRLVQYEKPKPVEILCDSYLYHARDDFFKFIAKIAGREHKTFPIVFLDGKLIGGFTDTEKLFKR